MNVRWDTSVLVDSATNVVQNVKFAGKTHLIVYCAMTKMNHCTESIFLFLGMEDV
jgi:hypothetical protein